MPELVFEIGCEEMPARFVAPAIEQLGRLAAEALARVGLLAAGQEEAVRAMGTPRRLAVIAQGLADHQADRREESLGPPKGAAFDADGQPTKAALGFAKSQGVDVGALQVIDTPKGPRLGVVRTVAGRPAPEVLAELLPELVGRISFPKTMRWGSVGYRFARPIHWFLAVLDGQVIPFELAGIPSGGVTYGHRFLAPGPLEVKGGGEYVARLQQAHVMVERGQRAAAVKAEVETAAAGCGGRLVDDPALLEEVTDLVELPVACCGSFDAEFLEVPREVIISAMRGHQRYFALQDDAGALLPNFIAVNNTKPKDLAVVTAGHERVLRARLADARFFLTEDTKRPLADFLEDLKQVTYHAKLGSSYDKVQRFAALTDKLAAQLSPEAAQAAHRAALLAKCDLVTEMVGEFPDLQGQVGREYARRSGEPEAVALAIEEHYLPAGADSAPPTGVEGALVGLADRLDTICGMFGIGQAPTGAADPFALRRAALGVIRIVTDRGWRLSLRQALGWALEGLAPWVQRPADEVADEVTAFFAARYQGLLTEQGAPTDVAQAVLGAGLDDLVAVAQRAQALAEVKDSPEFQPLAVGLKRVMNILKKEAGQAPDAPPSEELLEDGAERELYQAFKALEAEAQGLMAAGDYRGFLARITALKGPIDKFFDDVLVMAQDEQVRRNRLALLNQIAGLFAQLAEFTHLQLV